MVSQSETGRAAFPGFAPITTRAPYCLAVLVRGGEFRSADFVFPIADGGLTISGGIMNGRFVAPSDGSHGIYGKPLVVRGGVTGVGAISRVMGTMGNVKARVQAVKPMEVNDLLAFDLTLFLRIQVQNPFVGGDCYIGTSEDPLKVRMQRLDWDEYIPTLVRRDDIPGNVIAIAGLNVGGSKFRVPAATGAGPNGAFNTFVNSRASLPNRGTSTSLKIQAEAYIAQNPNYKPVG